MSTTTHMRDAFALAERKFHSPDMAALEGEELSMDELVNLRSGLKAVVAAGRAVLDEIESEIGERLGKGGLVRTDNGALRYSRPMTWKITEPMDFWRWVVSQHDDPETLVTYLSTLFNPDTVRIGQVPEAARWTFFEQRWREEPRVEELPETKLPAYAQDMAVGAVRQGGEHT